MPEELWLPAAAPWTADHRVLSSLQMFRELGLGAHRQAVETGGLRVQGQPGLRETMSQNKWAEQMA